MPKQPPKAGSQYLDLGVSSSPTLSHTEKPRAEVRSTQHSVSVPCALLHRWELGKKGVFNKIVCSLLTKVAPEYMGNSPRIFPHPPSPRPRSWWDAGMCNFSAYFSHFGTGRGTDDGARKGLQDVGKGHPLCCLSAALLTGLLLTSRSVRREMGCLVMHLEII